MAPHSDVGHLNSASTAGFSGLTTVPVPIWNDTSRAPTFQVAVIPFGRRDLCARSRRRNSAHWPVPPGCSEGWLPATGGSWPSDTAVLPPAPGHCTATGVGVG